MQIFPHCAAKSPQSCPTLCDPLDGSLPGSPVPGILQARILEWVAISFSNAWMWKVKVKLLSCVQLLATPWTAAYQAPPSMGFSRQEYCVIMHMYILFTAEPFCFHGVSLNFYLLDFLSTHHQFIYKCFVRNLNLFSMFKHLSISLQLISFSLEVSLWSFLTPCSNMYWLLHGPAAHLFSWNCYSMQVHVVNTQWVPTNRNVWVWSRERFIARPCKEMGGLWPQTPWTPQRDLSEHFF